LDDRIVSVETYPFLNLDFDPIDWYELPIDAYKAQEIAFNAIQDRFPIEHSVFIFSLARHFDYWMASFISDPQGAADIELMIDLRTGEILNVETE